MRVEWQGGAGATALDLPRRVGLAVDREVAEGGAGAVDDLEQAPKRQGRVNGRLMDGSWTARGRLMDGSWKVV